VIGLRVEVAAEGVDGPIEELVLASIEDDVAVRVEDEVSGVE
jgi:hypothetical protein